MGSLDTPEIEHHLQTGLRNFWYPVLPGWRLQDGPLGITRLGENLVLWRDAQGAIHAMEDRCPHRGARLSLGWNLGDRVACWYHGVEVTGEGVVAAVPAVQSSPLLGKCAVKRYPAKEVHGAIFVYFGDALHPEPPPLEFPEQLTSPQWSSFLCTTVWKCNYRYAIENVMDPMHGTYLHARSHSMAQGDRTAEFRVRNTASGLVFEKTNQQGMNFDWVEWGESGAQWMRLSIPYQKKFGPGGPFYIVGYVTPLDAGHCQAFFWRCRKVQGWQREVWRFLFRTRLEGLHYEVLEQDQAVLENMAPEARTRESLYQHDVGMARVRRLMETKARDDLQALHAAGK
jgi:phenylpropionate dioxygenase-like ring-hydroxylating dioxygenase large terminal subunit